MREILFQDRREAGTRLGAKLADHFPLGEKALALGLVRGGAVVADSLARAAGIAWDILIVRKIGAPHQPEYAVGAYAESGSILINEAARHQLELGGDWVAGAKQAAEKECDRLSRELRGNSALPALDGRTVVLTDDGMATGLSMFAAVEAAKAANAARIIVAVPVLAPDARSRLEQQSIEHVYLACPPNFFAVGQFYADFTPISTAVVNRLLKSRQ